MVLEALEAVLAADAQAAVPVVSAVAADSKNKYEVQKCTSYSFVHTFNEMPFMSDNANIDEDIIVSVINDDLLPLKEAIESLIKKY